MKIFTRNIKGKLIALAIGIVFFGGLQIFSMTIAKDDYVFGWLGDNKYSYVWVLAAVMIVFDQTLISYILMFGTVFGALIGKFLGDFLLKVSIAKITPDMDVFEKIYLRYHWGVYMYWGTVLVSLALGIVVALFQHQRKRELAKAQENNQN